MSDNRQTEILAAVNGLSSHVASLSAGIEKLEQDQTLFRMDLTARLDRLQNSAAAQRDEQVVDRGLFKRVEAIACGASAEVRALSEVVSGMQCQITRLQDQVHALQGEP